MQRGGLFAKKPPHTEHAVEVSGGHVLYVAEYGLATGTTLIYLHGGPGGGIPKDASRLFDPDLYRVVLYDQRGCGQSICDDRLRENTTEALVADLEVIRATLGIERWLVMGSSYGALLTALYAARHPSRVQGCLLHGVFLGSRAEVAWLFEGGASAFYPDGWLRFEAALGSSTLPPAREGEPLPHIAAFHALVNHTNADRSHPPSHSPSDHPADVMAAAAAAAVVQWEDDIETLAPLPPTSDDASEAVAGAQIALHHFYNSCFLPADGAVAELLAAQQAWS